jgi:hypothetical protein
MSEFLENLKARHAEAQKRFLAKQAHLNAVNAEYQTVAQEFNAWQTLLTLETRKEQGDNTVNVSATVVVSPQRPSLPSSTPSNTGTAAEVNKTEIVRDLLRQNSSGLTPTEIWRQVKTQIPHRPYLYSVLKRLKDRGDVTEKRGKYLFKFSPKVGEAKEQGLVT